MSTELPGEFVERMRRLEQALDAPLLERLGRRPRPVFRINRLHPDADLALGELRDAGANPTAIDGLPDAFAIEAEHRDALTRSGAAVSGALYVQGASSQRCAAAVGARPGERVLDLAAAPGGKTLALAVAMQDEGELVAVEAVRSRFFRLKDNLERAGVRCVRPIVMDGRRVPHAWDDSFDRVLLDAPCSAEARFVTGDAATYGRWSLKKVRDMARKQWGLLGAAIRCVKPGGVIVYATCSFAPEENEATVAAHVGASDAASELVPLDLGPGVETRAGLTGWGRKHWPDELALTRRIVPDELHEGAFLAQLRKR